MFFFFIWLAHFVGCIWYEKRRGYSKSAAAGSAKRPHGSAFDFAFLMPPIHSIVPRRSKLQYQWNRKSYPSARTKSLEKRGVDNFDSSENTWSIPVFRQENEQLQSSNVECQAIPNIRKLPKDRGPKALEALALPSVWNPQRHRTKIMPRSSKHHSSIRQRPVHRKPWFFSIKERGFLWG